MDFGLAEDLAVPGCNSDDFVRMRLRFYHWRRSYTKLVECNKWENEMEEMEVLVTPEQCTIFEDGEYARKAVKIIGQATGNNSFVPTMLEFTVVRDYLLATIALANGHRSGVSSNMTMAEYERAKNDVKVGKWLIGVKNHKTFRQHGPAMVCLPHQKFNMLKSYVEFIRPHFSKDYRQCFLVMARQRFGKWGCK